MWLVARVLIFLTLWSAMQLGALARDPDFAAAVFEHITQDQGLSNNAVNCLLQDRRGFLWVGTDDGLNRYDGHTFVVYRHQPDDPHSLPGNFVQTIYESPDGVLWIAAVGSTFCRYDAQRDAFIRYDLSALKERERDYYISSIYQDRNGLLWLGSGYGLVCLDPETRISALYFPGDDLRSQGIQALRSNYTHTVFEDASGRLFVGSEQGILVFDRQTKHFSVVLSAPLPIEKNNVRHFGFNGTPLGQLSDGRLCVALINWGVFLLDPQTLRVVAGYDLQGRHIQSDTPPHSVDPLSRGSVLGLHPSGSVWFSQRDLGLTRLHLETGHCAPLYRKAWTSLGFSLESIMAAFWDRSGVLWIGDRVHGLLKFSPSRNRFECYRHRPFDNTSLANSYIRGILEDRQGRLWVGSQFGGLCRLDRQTGQAERFNTYLAHRDRTPPRGVLAIGEDHRGTLWIGTDQGLYQFDPIRKRMREGPWPELPSLPTQVVYEDARRHLWIGMAERLFEIAPDRKTITDHTQSFPIFRVPSAGQLGHDVQCIYEDRQDGALWIGVNFGVVRYDPRRKTHRAYVIERRPEYGIPYVTHLTEDADGTLWMTTKGAGLCRFDPQRETFTHILEKDGLPHNNCYALFPDATGVLWLSSDAGIARFEPQRRHFRTYTTTDGLQGREFNRFAAFQNGRGEIFFGGTNGLNIFHPADLTDNIPPPLVAITNLKVNGTARLAREGMFFSLSHEETSLDIGYAGLDFNAPGDTRYRYWLEGFDATWRDVGARREANYTNLPPGQYRFWVMAANHDGVWSTGKLLLRIVIQPPWWRTWPAYVGFALVGGLVLYGGVRLRLRQLVARNRLLEAKVSERTQEVRRKNEELIGRNIEIAARTREAEEQRRNMVESLTYARMIQQATLPTEPEVSHALGEHFILWKPKDIVSGDFYWVCRRDGIVILVVADCTGHGVPGAFMSMIGNDLLGQIALEQSRLEPARILLKLHHGIRRALKQQDETQLPDGMDAAVCRFDQRAQTVTFAGARRPLYLVADGILTEIKGDRYTLGGGGRERQPRVFTNHEVVVTPGATLYLTTDGFADQPDEQGKKFGTQRLKNLLLQVAPLPLDQQQTRLEMALFAHMGGELQRDDITVVGVRWNNGKADSRQVPT